MRDFNASQPPAIKMVLVVQLFFELVHVSICYYASDLEPVLSPPFL